MSGVKELCLKLSPGSWNQETSSLPLKNSMKSSCCRYYPIILWYYTGLVNDNFLVRTSGSNKWNYDYLAGKCDQCNRLQNKNPYSVFITQISPFVLTGGHFVVGSWDPVARHCRGQGWLLPLALGGGPVAGWRPTRRGASVWPGWISEWWRWRTHRGLQRWRLLEYWWLRVAAVGGLLQWGMSEWWKKKKGKSKVNF